MKTKRVSTDNHLQLVAYTYTEVAMYNIEL